MMIAFHKLPGVCVGCAGPLPDHAHMVCAYCLDGADSLDAAERRIDPVDVLVRVNSFLWWGIIVPIATLGWCFFLIFSYLLLT